jgi:AraC-like DNA-binding protein
MPDQPSPNVRMSSAIRIIHARLSDPLLRSSLVADRLGLRLPVFCQAFRKATGMTCTDYIALRRIRLAKKLLRENSLLVKEIAHRVGYESSSYFSRRFRQIEGRPPSSYRRLNHSGSGIPLTRH